MDFKRWACVLALACSGALSAWAAEDSLPVRLNPAEPRYPDALANFGNTGTVTATFVINEDARPEDIEIRYSPHPAFEQAVVDTLLEGRYRAAVQDGHPVKKKILQKFVFAMPGGNEADKGGFEPFAFAGKADDGLPPEFQYDKPPRIRVLAPLVYPYEMMVRRVPGSAEVLVTIDPQGQVQAVKVVSATHPQFGQAAKAMLATTTFRPATWHGEGRWFVLRYKQTFNLEDRELAPSAGAERLLAKLRHQEEEGLYQAGQLDARPKTLYQPEPIWPIELQKADVHGQVVVEFFIDKEGRTQLPRIIKAADADLGAAAVTAVRRWRFEPPRVNGKPVDVRMRTPLVFEKSDEAEPDKG